MLLTLVLPCRGQGDLGERQGVDLLLKVGDKVGVELEELISLGKVALANEILDLPGQLVPEPNSERREETDAGLAKSDSFNLRDRASSNKEGPLSVIIVLKGGIEVAQPSASLGPLLGQEGQNELGGQLEGLHFLVS